MFVVLFENRTSTSAVDDALTASGIRTFTIKATDSTAEFGSGPESMHAATKLLQAIVMDKVLSTEFEQTSQLSKTLRSSHITLYEACQRVCNFLDVRIDGARKSSSSTQFDISALQPLLEESTMLAEQAHSRIGELDTEDLELMESVTGLTSTFHQHQIWHVGSPPKFSFDVTTPFPIRVVIKDKSDNSIWIPETEPELGVFKFVAEVQNEPRSNAFARVELFRWRKEIHGKELEEMRRIATEQKDLITQLSASIESNR